MSAVRAWRVLAPDGQVVVPFASTRHNAIGCVWGLDVTDLSTLQRLDRADRSTAGWSPIEVDGWRVEPAPRAREAAP